MNYANASIHPIGDVRLLSVDETRERLGGICRNTLKSLDKRQELVPIRIEKRVFYRSVDVELFILGHTQGSESSEFADQLRFLVSPTGRVIGVSFGREA